MPVSRFRSFGPVVSSLVLAAGVAALAAPAVASAGVLHVADGASGDCSEWAKACTLQTALGAAASGDEVWVRKGLYKPGSGRADTFTIHAGVAVYGGFAGTETALAERDPAANLTVLSGDIDGDDAATADGIDETASAIAGGNSYHVVTMDGTGAAQVLGDTLLDGFTITAGDAGGAAFPDNSGAGLYCDGSGSGAACSPTLSRLTFSGNHAARHGGGLFNNGENGGNSSPRLSDVTFHGNGSDLAGGAVFNDGESGGRSSPDLKNVTFSDNTAGCFGCSVCGNSAVEPGEVCDDGNTVDEMSCPYGQPSCTTCNSTCSAVLNLTGAYCGDGSKDPGEFCDDGNNVDETGCPYGQANCTTCNSTCSGVLNLTGNYCGDGSVDPNNEFCDDGNNVTESSCPYGQASCATCNSDCSAVLNLTGNYCGDGSVDPEHEVCDDGNTVTETSCPPGQASCTACNATCTQVLFLTGSTAPTARSKTTPAQAIGKRGAIPDWILGRARR